MSGEIKSSNSERICITSQGDSLDSLVDPRFGRCQYFIKVDLETLKFEAILNPNIESSGGAGIQSAQLIVDSGVSAVLSGNIGHNAFKVLKAAGLNNVTGEAHNGKEAIKKYVNGELKSSETSSVDSHFGIS